MTQIRPRLDGVRLLVRLRAEPGQPARRRVLGRPVGPHDDLLAHGQLAHVLQPQLAQFPHDARVRDLLAGLNHADTMTALAAERAFLAELDGSCRTPIAGHATVAGGNVRFHGMILKPDGSETRETRREGDAREAEALGADAGRELKNRAPADFFKAG